LGFEYGCAPSGREQDRSSSRHRSTEGGAIIRIAQKRLSVFERGGQSSILELSLTGSDPARYLQRGLHAITQGLSATRTSAAPASRGGKAASKLLESQLDPMQKLPMRKTEMH